MDVRDGAGTRSGQVPVALTGGRGFFFNDATKTAMPWRARVLFQGRDKKAPGFGRMIGAG